MCIVRVLNFRVVGARGRARQLPDGDCYIYIYIYIYVYIHTYICIVMYIYITIYIYNHYIYIYIYITTHVYTCCYVMKLHVCHTEFRTKRLKTFPCRGPNGRRGRRAQRNRLRSVATPGFRLRSKFDKPFPI